MQALGKGASHGIEKLLREVCLLEQPFVKEPGIAVEQYLRRKSRELGESVTIRRFARFQLGQDASSAAEGLA